MNQKHYVRLPIQNAYNVRELGGYACTGGLTRWNTLLRADDLSRLSESDVAFLKDYGLTCDIDLRSSAECDLQPDVLETAEGIAYHNIPLMTNVITDVNHDAYHNPEFLSTMYIQLIDKAKGPLKRVMQTILDAPGGVLFHCAGGKDRTGVVSMLLLGLVGVAREDIVAHYQTTYTYIAKNPDMIKFATAETLPAMQSNPAYIEAVLDHIDTAFGGIPQFLSSIGLTQDELDRLKAKIAE